MLFSTHYLYHYERTYCISNMHLYHYIDHAIFTATDRSSISQFLLDYPINLELIEIFYDVLSYLWLYIF